MVDDKAKYGEGTMSVTPDDPVTCSRFIEITLPADKLPGQLPADRLLGGSGIIKKGEQARQIVMRWRVRSIGDPRWDARGVCAAERPFIQDVMTSAVRELEDVLGGRPPDLRFSYAQVYLDGSFVVNSGIANLVEDLQGGQWPPASACSCSECAKARPVVIQGDVYIPPSGKR